MKIWQLQEAKAKLSELIKSVLQIGPQGISVRGVFEIVVMSRKEYEKMKSKPQNLVDFINQSPLKNLDLDLCRDKSRGREINL
jgi:prevent-host-death family protein